jgi:hypothetical protein
MKIPAKRARIARIGLRPPREANVDRPVRISQMLNNRKPIFFVIFMAINPFFL